MELQGEGRREIAEKLMKGGVREPDRYLKKEEPKPVAESEAKKEEEVAEEKKSDPEPAVEKKDGLEKAIADSEQEQ
jgi:hypothetical protein